MKKMYIILGIMMILIASAVAASFSVTYNFRDIQTWQPLSNVDTLVYPCLDSGCNVLNLAMPLPGSGNSGSSSQATVVYPTSLVTPYGYAAYYFAHGYAPQEYLATWQGNGAAVFDINFNKIANCMSQILKADIAEYTPTPIGADVRIDASVRSAFTDPHNYVGYVLPQYADEFYSSLIEIRFRIYDSNNASVYQVVRTRNIYMDGEDGAETDLVSLAPGTYRIEVETVVTDNQCSNTVPQLISQVFTIPLFPPLEAALTANPTSGIEPLNVTFTCSADGGIGPYTFTFNSDDSSGQSTVSAGPNMGDYRQFFVTGYMAGTYQPSCEVTDSIGTTDDSNIVTITVAQLPPVNNPPVVNLISPPNGATIIIPQIGDNTLYFTYNITDDLSDVLNCTIYTNLTGVFQAGYSQSTNNNSIDFFVMLTTSVPDGTYIWNIECSDGQLSAFAQENWTFTVNTTLPPLPQCSDGFDNDGDGKIDFPADPGCDDANDDNETDIITNQPPVVILISPPNGTTIVIAPIGDNTLHFSYNVTDDLSNILNCTLYTNLSGTFMAETSQSTLNNTMDSFLRLITGVSDGVYIWNVQCSDGTLSAFASHNNTLIINSTTPPVTGLNVTLTASPVFGVDPLDVNFNCSVEGGVSPFNYTLDSNGTQFFSITENARTVLTQRTFSKGIYNITCTITDNEGRTGSDSVEIAVAETPPITNLAPNVTLISPPNGTITSNPNIIFSYNVTDDSASILLCTLYTNISGAFSPQASQFTFNSTENSFSVQNIPNGNYTWNVQCNDGLLSAFAPENWTFAVNSTTPPVTGLNVTLTANPVFGIDPLNVDFNCSVEGGVSPFDYTIDSNGTQFFSITRNARTALTQRTFSEGTYNITCTVTDDEGRTGLDSVQITVLERPPVVNEAPNVTLISPPNNTITDNPNVTFSYNVTDDSASILLCTLYTNISGAFSPQASQFTFNSTENSFSVQNIPNGNYTWNVQCNDGLLSAFAPENWTFAVNTTLPPLPECSDGFDNDGDGLIDFPADPGCISQFDNNETDGSQANEAPFVVLMYPFNHMVTNDTDMPFMYMVFDDSALLLNCTLYTNISGTFQPEQNLLTINGFFGIMLEQNIPDGTYIWNVECSDGELSAFAPENWTFTVTRGAPIYQCNDGIDNDGDNLTDYPNDPGCASPSDNNETNPITPLPQCSDGIDNDGDGLIDYPNDIGCVNATDNDEGGHGSNGNNGGPIIIPEILDPEQILYIGHIDIHSTTNTGFEQEIARAGDEVEISVYLENLAPYTLKSLKLSVYIDGLAIWRTIGPFNLAPGQHTTKHVYMDVPDDAKKGIYDVRIVVGNEDIKRVKYRIVKVIGA